MKTIFFKPAFFGFSASAALLLIYFSALTLISGWNFTKIQFFQNWYWILGLSLGFGIQIALFSYLRVLHRNQVSGKVVAASGSTSTFAMLACCSHYLVNLLPIIGIAGIATLIGQYQTEFFIIGLISNLIGIGYMLKKLKTAKSA